MSDVVPVVELDLFPDLSQFALLNPQGSQVSHLSSVQLSPNRVCVDFDWILCVPCICGVSEIWRVSTPYLVCFVTGVSITRRCLLQTTNASAFIFMDRFHSV